MSEIEEFVVDMSLHGLAERIVSIPSGAFFVKRVRAGRSTIHRWRRDTRFFLCYLYGSVVFPREALEEVVRAAFKHPRLTGVSVRLYPTSGTRKGADIYWGAPITVTVEIDGVAVVGMALDIKFSSLRIWQLQGAGRAEGTQLPKLPSDIQPWPQLFIETVMTFAKQQGFKEVLVRQAEHLPCWSGCSKLRSRLKTIHDTTTKRLGFIRDKVWWVWKVDLGDINMICRVCQGSQNLFWVINKKCAPDEIKNAGYHWVTCPVCHGAGTYWTYGPATIQAKQKAPKRKPNDRYPDPSPYVTPGV